MNGLIATKVGMSRVFLANGDSVPVTYLRVEPNTVVRAKTTEKDGYNALVLGTKSNVLKTRKGKEHLRYRTQKEWRVENINVPTGSQLTCALVPKDSVVTITGTSKGKGFQGVIKRHHMAGGPGSHGSHFHREPGSVGMREHPGRIVPGKRMPGHMGKDTITKRGCAVLVSDVAAGVIAIKGPVPGPNGATVYVTVETWPEGFDVNSLFGGAVEAPAAEAPVETPVVEAPKEEAAPESTAPQA